MMECLTPEVLCLHIQHELDAQTQQHVETHLRACQNCTDRFRTMQEHDAMLRSVLVRSPAQLSPEPALLQCGGTQRLRQWSVDTPGSVPV